MAGQPLASTTLALNGFLMRNFLADLLYVLFLPIAVLILGALGTIWLVS